MKQAATDKEIFVLFPPKTSLGGLRIETFLKDVLAISSEQSDEVSRSILKLVVSSSDLTSIRYGETLILRGYPKPGDPQPSRVLAQNFLHFFPWVGPNINSLKNIVLAMHWLLFAGRIRGIVFQTNAGLERATGSLIGRLVMTLHRPEVSVEQFYRPAPIRLTRPVTTDLFVITSTLPHKCPLFAVKLARRLVVQTPGARVAVTLPQPSDHNPDREHGIEYLGCISESRVRELIGSSAIVAIPSVAESFSLPLHDCLHAGVPVVCFKNILPDLETPLVHAVAFGDVDDALNVVRSYLRAN